MLSSCEYIVGNLAGEDLLDFSNSYFKIQGSYLGKNIDIETIYPVINEDNPGYLTLAANVEKLGFDFKILGLQIITTGLLPGDHPGGAAFSMKEGVGEVMVEGASHLFIDEYNSGKIKGNFYIETAEMLANGGYLFGEFYIEFDDLH